MSIQELYDQVLEMYSEKTILNQVAGLVGWDFETMMPKKAVEQRGGMMAFLSKLDHQMSTDPKLGELLASIENSDEYKDLSDIEKRNILLVRRAYDKNTKIPVELIVEKSKLGATAIDVWKKAREANDWKLFEPYLSKMVALMKKIAHHLDAEKDPYDVLLDFFEPGMDMEQYDAMFTELREGTIDLINRINRSNVKVDRDLISKKVTIPIQEKLMDELIAVIGYDLDGGRLDVAAHPFTGGPGYDDVRITTRYDEHDFASSFFSVAHEGGHGIYEQFVSPDFRYQPIGEACSMGIHESQSRFFENIICRSPGFWKFFFPKLKEITSGIYDDLDFDEFLRAINIVRPSKIRVEADEVTYNLHVILRYEIERDIVNERIKVSEIPEVWNRMMKEYLGLDIETDSEGAMQDIHWCDGAFGYFPTYTLGNIYGAQFLHVLNKEMPDWEEKVMNGDIKSIRIWLNEKVHHEGNLYDPMDLVEKITGEKPNVKYLLEYLNTKYSQLYEI
jgi:carboxypeptidase Taq